MLILSQLETQVKFNEINIKKIKDTKEWKKTEKDFINEYGKEKIESFSKWNGLDMITDFYKLRNADSLALRDISKNRMEEYILISEKLSNSNTEMNYYDQDELKNISISKVFKNRFNEIFNMMLKFRGDYPSEDFIIDLKTGDIKEI
jgi:hypothetical protein